MHITLIPAQHCLAHQKQLMMPVYHPSSLDVLALLLFSRHYGADQMATFGRLAPAQHGQTLHITSLLSQTTLGHPAKTHVLVHVPSAA